MNYAALIAFIVCAIWWIDSQLPTAEDEEAQGKRDMEALIKRVNEEANDRPRVRAGNNLGVLK